MPVVEADLAVAKADQIVDSYGAERSSLIHVMQDIQEALGYLPRGSLRTVSERLHVPLAEVLRVATFYAAFNLAPQGEHVITVCIGTACHVRGARSVLERIQRELSVPAGGTTPDGKFTLRTVNCLGACALGPLVSVDGKYHGKMTAARIGAVLEECGVAGHGKED
jgi:NADH-quinone oxidoreductase subunit E